MSSEFYFRPAILEDAAAIAKVHVDAWRETYRGIMLDETLDGLSYEQRTTQRRENLKTLVKARKCCFVVEDKSGEVTGFSMAGPIRAECPPFDSELYAIYLLKKCQGRGAGRDLFQVTASHLSQQGFKSMMLWVLRENATRGFYEAMGGEKIGSKIVEIGKPLEEVSYGWPDITIFRR